MDIANKIAEDKIQTAIENGEFDNLPHTGKPIDLKDYFKADDFESVSFGNLKPSSRSISVRLPEYLLMRLKEKANALRIPYQSLIKQYIAKGLLM